MPRSPVQLPAQLRPLVTKLVDDILLALREAAIHALSQEGAAAAAPLAPRRKRERAKAPREEAAPRAPRPAKAPRKSARTTRTMRVHLFEAPPVAGDITDPESLLRAGSSPAIGGRGRGAPDTIGGRGRGAPDTIGGRGRGASDTIDAPSEPPPARAEEVPPASSERPVRTAEPKVALRANEKIARASAAGVVIRRAR